MKRRDPVAWAALVLVVPGLAGCPFFFGNGDDDGGDPCDADPAGCGEGETFELDPSCTLTGALQLELGQGEKSYSKLVAGEEPVVYYGPQGGSHTWLGVRVLNHARGYPQLDVHLELVDRPYMCADPCTEWEPKSTRDLVLGESTLELTDDGGAQAAGITVFADGWGESQGRGIRVTVLDPCGREGTLVHEIDG